MDACIYSPCLLCISHPIQMPKVRQACSLSPSLSAFSSLSHICASPAKLHMVSSRATRSTLVLPLLQPACTPPLPPAFPSPPSLASMQGHEQLCVSVPPMQGSVCVQPYSVPRTMAGSARVLSNSITQNGVFVVLMDRGVQPNVLLAPLEGRLQPLAPKEGRDRVHPLQTMAPWVYPQHSHGLAIVFIAGATGAILGGHFHRAIEGVLKLVNFMKV